MVTEIMRNAQHMVVSLLSYKDQGDLGTVQVCENFSFSENLAFGLRTFYDSIHVTNFVNLSLSISR